jgi:hypothetical protein
LLECRLSTNHSRLSAATIKITNTLHGLDEAGFALGIVGLIRVASALVAEPALANLVLESRVAGV